MEYKNFKIGDFVVNIIVKVNSSDVSIGRIVEIPVRDRIIQIENEKGETHYEFRTFYRKATEQELKIHRLKKCFNK